MANRRMISKDIAHRSRFLSMPSEARDLYHYLVLEADDEGFTEAFAVMRMINANEQTLKILEQNSFIEIYQDLVVRVVDWDISNKVQPSRLTPSRYRHLKPIVLSTTPQQYTDNVPTQDRLGKVSLDIDDIKTTTNNDISKISIEKFEPTNHDELVLLDIAKATEDKHMNFLLSVYNAGNFWAIEKAYGVFREIDKSKIEDKASYFNSLVQSCIRNKQ